MLCWAPCAPLLGWAVSVQLAVLVHARTAALSPSSRGRRLSIHLEVGEDPSRARIVTTGAEEREVRGSLGCPSAPPASSATATRSAQPSPAALLGTAVLTSPALPPAPQRSGSGGGWGAASEDEGV